MDNRSALLDVALLLFSRRGYDAVGVQEIVEASGVTKPTLYHYFTSKLGLLHAVCDRDEARLTAALGRAAEYQGDVPLTLNRVVTAAFNFATLHPQYAGLRLALQHAPPDSEAGQLVASLVRSQRALLEDVFATAARDHGAFRGRSRRYAVSLLAVVDAHVGVFLQGGPNLDADLAFGVVHQFMHGIYS